MQFCNIRNRSMRVVYLVISGALWILLVACMSQVAPAQTFAGSISGTVIDPSGAVVVGAKLQLQNMATKDTRLQTSSSSGGYRFTNLLPGTYQISASAAGFQNFLQTGMVLNANTAATVDVHLQVGSAAQQVEVSAGGAVLLDTASANNQVTLPSVLVQNLPENTLEPLSFVYAFAGTTESQGGMTSLSSNQDQMFSTFGINGGRSAESEILIDGAPSTAIDWGGLMVSPINDSVQEEQVMQNVYDAQYERGGEGVVTLVTRSGSSQFHGEAYDFMRNDGLDANSWSADFNGYPKGKFHRNQFGGNLGGPILNKRHVYFFGAYEGLRQPGVASLVANVPTAAERSGDFSNSGITIYDPSTTRQVTDSSGNTYFTRDPFPGNKIPTGQINVVGQKIANLYGTPTRGGQGGNDVNNFARQGTDTTINDKFDWRIDWNQNPKHRLFVRMSDRLREGDTPSCFFCNGADSNYANHDDGAQVVVNDTYTPTPTWVIDTYGAYSRWLEGQDLVDGGAGNPGSIGLNKDLFQISMLPIVHATNYTSLGNQYSSFDRYVRYSSTGLIDVTKQLNRHTLKLGFNYDVSMINHRSDWPGIFDFSGQFTSCAPTGNGQPCKASNSGAGTTGNAIADMLLGIGSGGGADINMDPAFSAHSMGMYVQDDWRISPRLTLSAGLRYENQRPATERYNRVAYFDLGAVNPLSTAYGSTLKGAFEYAGVDGRGRNSWEPDNKDFGPRLGIAYRVTDKLMWRVGAGMFYAPASAMLSFDGGGQSPGYTAHTTWLSTSNNGFSAGNLVNNPFPNGMNQPTGNKLGAMTYVGDGTSQLWPKLPHPVGTIYQWSMDFQYQASPNSVAEIGYTGVRGRKLMFGNPNFDLDQLPTGDLSLGSKLDQNVTNPFYGIAPSNTYLGSQKTIAYNELLRPFPEYTYLIQTRSLPGARSQFDALNVKYQYTFHGGLSSITTYQWSKNLDDGSEALLGWTIGGSWRDAYNPKLDYALSTHDVPQSFVQTWYYELPYGTGRKFGSTAPQFVRQTIGGWNVSGIVRLTSGYPLWLPVEFGYNNHLGNYGFPGYALPNLVGNPIPKNRGPNNWINRDAFQGLSSSGSGQLVTCGPNGDPNCQPFPYSYGNEPQHYSTLREAPTKNVDLGVSKEFAVKERANIELRGDFLNAFNHPTYGGAWNIQNHFGWGPVGQVYGTRNDPRNIQAALKITF